MMKSKHYSVVGLMYGDEGKGKLTDALIQKLILLFGAVKTIVCGINGGSNAGHTTNIDGVDYHTHFLPSGVLSEGVINYCGNNKVLEPMSLKQEHHELSKKFKDIPKRTYFSELTQVTTIGHLIIDRGEQGKRIGTTGKGIGITYATKCTRTGINLCDIVNLSDEELKSKLEKLYTSIGLQKHKTIMSRFRMFMKKYLNKLYNYMGLSKYDTIITIKKLDDTDKLVNIDIDSDRLFSFKDDLDNFHDFKKTWKNVVPSTYFRKYLLHENGYGYVYEMSNAVMLDTTHGSYPNVTSSACTPNGILDSLSLNIKDKFISDIEIFGVAKAYITRVGEGTLPTDMSKDDKEKGDILVDCGKEYGVTTGRRRTPGHINLPELGHTIEISGVTAINLTRPDNYSNVKGKIKIASGYTYSDGSPVIEGCYQTLEEKLSKVVPIYTEIDGWYGFDFTKVKTYDDLHPNVKKYIEIIEEYTGVKVKAINTGRGRDQIIFRE
jgi:adenylosuccinate synthase